MPVKEKKKDIFISYRREDGQIFAYLLAKTLLQKGYSVFYDREDLVAGSVFPQKLTESVEGCREFIAVVSPMYLGARKNGVLRIHQDEDWVQQELCLALKSGKSILPVLVGTTCEENWTLLPEVLAGLKGYNVIQYDSAGVIDDFIAVLEKGFSAETVKNRKYNTLIRDLYSVSDEKDNDFNVKIRNLILGHNEEVVGNKLIPLIRDREEPEDVCFAAYYAAFTFYRRLGYVYKIHNLVAEFGQRFSVYRFNNIVMSQHYSSLFELEGHKPEDLRSAVSYAQAAMEAIPENTGVMQNFADLITKSFELGVNRNKKQLQQAVDRIAQALELNPKYPKYHCTMGRLLAFKHRYDEAVVSIQKAISLENMETKDSFIRTVEYNKYIHEIRLRRTERNLKRFCLGVAGVLAGLGLAGMGLLFMILERGI